MGKYGNVDIGRHGTNHKSTGRSRRIVNQVGNNDAGLQRWRPRWLGGHSGKRQRRILSVAVKEMRFWFFKIKPGGGRHYRGCTIAG